MSKEERWSLKGNGIGLLYGETLSMYEQEGTYLYSEKVIETLRLRLIEDITSYCKNHFRTMDDDILYKDDLKQLNDIRNIISRRFGV